MPRNLARLTPLQARKQLLVATTHIQRAQCVEDLQNLRSQASDLAGRARQRIQSAGIAVAVLSLAAAAVSMPRRTSKSPRSGGPSMMLRILPWVRLAMSLWISHATGGKFKTPT